MKSNHPIRIALIAAALLLALCTPALMKNGFSQIQSTTSVSPKFALIEYFKIEPGKGTDYRKLEQEVWMPIALFAHNAATAAPNSKAFVGAWERFSSKNAAG